MGAAGIILQAAGAASSAQAELQQGKDTKNYYSYLAGTSKINADLARAAGVSESQSVGAEENQQVQQINEQGRAVVGAQKVALASGGAGVGSKTAEQLVSDTANKVNLDEMALRYNADLKMKNIKLKADTEALNYESQATGYKIAGDQAKRASKSAAWNTILGAGSSVAANWKR
jgi:hypothetical protein